MSRSASTPHPRNPIGRLPACIALACLYVITGRLGLLLAVPPGYATAIFPPAGIAVAAMFISGSSTLPWTFIGSFTLNLWNGAAEHGLSGLEIGVALIIAAASTLQAACGGWAFRRLIGYPAALDNGPDVARFFLGAPFVCLISATLSLSGMALLHAIDMSDIAASWFIWWMGDTLGVLLFLPIAMLGVGEPRALWAGRAGPLALPMLVFFAFFVAVFVRIGNWQSQQSLIEFRLLSQQITDQLRAQLAAQEMFLEQLRTSFSGPALLSREDFATRARIVLTHFPPIQAIGWAPRVPAADRATFEAAQQHDAPGFTVREQTQTGGMQPAAPRAEAFPIAYVEPLESNRGALGFDLTSEPVRRAAVLGAIATGEITASAPTHLLQLQGEQSGLLLTTAVRKGPDGPGIVFIALRITTLMNALLAPAQQQLGVQLIDQEVGRPLFDTIPADNPGPTLIQEVGFGGRQYPNPHRADRALFRASPGMAKLGRAGHWRAQHRPVGRAPDVGNRRAPTLRPAVGGAHARARPHLAGLGGFARRR